MMNRMQTTTGGIIPEMKAVLLNSRSVKILGEYAVKKLKTNVRTYDVDVINKLPSIVKDIVVVPWLLLPMQT